MKKILFITMIAAAMTSALFAEQMYDNGRYVLFDNFKQLYDMLERNHGNAQGAAWRAFPRTTEKAYNKGWVSLSPKDGESGWQRRTVKYDFAGSLKFSTPYIYWFDTAAMEKYERETGTMFQ